ncbi:MAG: DUF262 domain-containing HNH endonuclease family protein [Malacoplasma sp.]
MEIEKVSIEELLRSYNRLIIPFYQREYVWTANETKRLLEDIINSKTKEYFIGSIVLKGDNDYKIVIDGQQRLSTIWLILKALFGKKEYLNSENSKLIENHLTYFNFQTSGLKDGDVLAKIISDKFDLTDEQKKTNYYLNHLEIQKFFEMYSGRLDNFYERFSNVIAAKVVVDKNTDEHILFSQINSTGKKLMAFDLVKNSLFSEIATNLDELDKRDKNKILEEKLNIFNFATNISVLKDAKYKDEIIRHFISYRTSKLCNNNQEKIYIAYSDLFKKVYHNNVETFFDDFIRFALIYKYIYTNDFAKYKFRNSLIFLTNSFKTYSILIIDTILKNSSIENSSIILLINNSQEDEIFNTFLILENYKIRREFCDLKEKTITRFIPNLVAKIDFLIKNTYLIKDKHLKYSECLFYWIYIYSNNHKNFLKHLPSYRMPLDDEFKVNFKSKKIYDSRIFCKNFLIRLGSTKARIDFSNFTIEHILPQDLDKWLKDGFVIDLEQAELKKHTIGNLTLTAYNPEYSNHPFLKKVELMKKNESFVLNNYFFNLDKWNLNSINTRAESLFDMTMKIWNFYEIEGCMNNMKNDLDSLISTMEIVKPNLSYESDENIETLIKNKSYFKRLTKFTNEEIKEVLFNYMVDGLGHEKNEFLVFKMKFDGWISYSIITYFFESDANKKSSNEHEFNHFYSSIENKIQKLEKTISDLIK